MNLIDWHSLVIALQLLHTLVQPPVLLLLSDRDSAFSLMTKRIIFSSFSTYWGWCRLSRSTILMTLFSLTQAAILSAVSQSCSFWPLERRGGVTASRVGTKTTTLSPARLGHN